jgi:hypothetical protein
MAAIAGNFKTVTVGERFPEDTIIGSHYRADSLFMVEKFSPYELQAFFTGRARFGLFRESGARLAYFLYHFGGKGGFEFMGDSPFNWHSFSDETYAFAPPGEPDGFQDGQGVHLTVFVIDPVTRITTHMRAIGLGTQFSRTLHAIAVEQLQQPKPPYSWEELAREAHSRHTVKEMFDSAEIVYTAGTRLDRGGN